MHPTCVMGQDVVLACDAWLGPFVTLGDKVKIGARTRLLDGVSVGNDVVIDEDCILHPACTVLDGVRLGKAVTVGPHAVIGADGFGFVEDGGVHHKIPQVGGVVIEDGVVIAEGVCIDRGTTSDTRVGKSTRVGAQAQIGHNVRIGSNCVIGAHAALAGSGLVEDGVVLGDAVGMVPHAVIRRGAVVEARAGVTKEVAADSHVAGYPMRTVEEHRWLCEQLDRVQVLVARIERLEKKLGLEGETS